MLISLNWLKKYIDLDNIDIKELENALTMIGQEVEKIDVEGSNLDNVVTAKITKYDKHPDSDHLTLCEVYDGVETYQIVCGASNHKLGDVVALAKIGAKLDDNFVIKKGKIRGVESYGMLCSQVELKIGHDDSGIIIFPEDTSLGVPLKEYLKLDDTIFELEITPNRPDCLSYIGIARELSCYYRKELKYPILNNIEIKDDSKIKISIDNNLSKRYMTRVIKNVKVGKSPEWLTRYLEKVGVRSINNLVDISNYVMLELNQPNHIFDYDKLSGDEINVTTVNDGYKFTTLDEKEYELSNSDIVIKDSEKVVALAGVMGGLNSSVTDETRNILIEVAHFDNISVRKTSRKLNIISESSYRFERRIDTENFEFVMNRITDLVLQLSGGEVSNISDNYLDKYEYTKTIFNIERFYRFVGKKIEIGTIKDILKGLEINILSETENHLELVAPSYRDDLKNEFDYFEEIIRMYGFDNIENVLPRLDTKTNRLKNNIKDILNIKNIVSSIGLNEVINYSFIPKNFDDLINFKSSYDYIEISNPIIEDFKIMRPTLLYSLLKNVKDNFNRNNNNLRLFEISKTFVLNKEQTDKLDNSVYIDSKKIIEENVLSVVLAGETEKSIYENSRTYDFYDLKAIVEHVFNKLKFNKYKIVRSSNNFYHPMKSADIFVGKELIGSFGEVHIDVLENMNLEKSKIYACEINIDKMLKYVKDKINYSPLSQYPSVNRDIAILVDKNLLVGELLNTVEKIDKLVEKVTLFDVYTGNNIDSNMKSIAFNITLRDKNKTLSDEEIINVMNKIENKLLKDYKAVIR